MNKLKATFLYSGAAVLIVTALAKLYSLTGGAKLLHTPDPLLRIEYEFLLPAVALAELAVAGILLFGRWEKMKFLSLLWLSLNFMLYRLGYWFLGLPLTHCKCLGHLTDALRLKPEPVEAIMRGLVLYLLAGSLIGLLACLWRERNLQPNVSSNWNPIPGVNK